MASSEDKNPFGKYVTHCKGRENDALKTLAEAKKNKTKQAHLLSELGQFKDNSEAQLNKQPSVNGYALRNFGFFRQNLNRATESQQQRLDQSKEEMKECQKELETTQVDTKAAKHLFKRREDEKGKTEALNEQKLSDEQAIRYLKP